MSKQNKTAAETTAGADDLWLEQWAVSGRQFEFLDEPEAIGVPIVAGRHWP